MLHGVNGLNPDHLVDHKYHAQHALFNSNLLWIANTLDLENQTSEQIPANQTQSEEGTIVTLLCREINA
jgi:hypothetical protein